MSRWLAALRIARREARRAKGRSALVVALIGLPVLALTFAAVSYDMFTLTTEEELERRLGTAEAEIRWVSNRPIDQPAEAERDADAEITVVPTTGEIEAELPPGSRAIPRWHGSSRMPTGAGIGWLDWIAVDLADPLAHGTGRLLSGQLPGPGEVALTTSASARLDAVIGDRIEVFDEGSYEVVGTVEFPGGPGWFELTLTQQMLLFHPDTAPGTGSTWLVGTPEPVSWQQVQELNQRGMAVFSRAVALDPPPGVVDDPSLGHGTHDWLASEAELANLSVGALVAGLAVLEIVLLAGPAFAVGARRRQRDLALVAANGGSPAQLRRIVLADGVVLGAVAGVVGVVLGIAAAFAARPLLEVTLVGARAGGYRVFPLALAGIALFAVGTAVLAALVPAFTAARQQVVNALAGRREAGRARRRWLVLGIALAALGGIVTAAGARSVATNVILAGLILGQLGLALCTPTLIGVVARLGSRLPLAPRVALRDTARNRAAAAPAVAAVMAAVAGGVGAGVIVLGLENQGTYFLSHMPGTALVYDGDGIVSFAGPGQLEDATRATLPVASFHREWIITCPEGDSPDETCFPPNVKIDPDQVCPYWSRVGAMTSAEQQAAREDPRCDDLEPYGWVTVDDGTALSVYANGGEAELAEARQVLIAGGAVVSDPRYLIDGQVTLVPPPENRAAHGEVAVPGYLLTGSQHNDRVIISPAAARQTGVIPEPVGNLLVATTRMPTVAEQDAFFAATENLGANAYIVAAPPTERADPRLIMLTLAAAMIALGAAGIATGLAAADRRADLSTLAAVGASPRLRRTLSLSQSGVIAGLGTALGLAAGLGASTAVLFAMNQRWATTWPTPEPIPIGIPWTQLSALLAVPLVAMLGAGLLSRSRLPIERRLA